MVEELNTCTCPLCELDRVKRLNAAKADVACDDAMRLLEAIATIIDGPIADTRLHDWSGLPERTRLKVQRLYQTNASPTSIEQLVLWLQGEKTAATRIINSCGPEQAVMAAVGLHAAYRATLAKIAGHEPTAPPDAKETK